MVLVWDSSRRIEVTNVELTYDYPKMSGVEVNGQVLPVTKFTVKTLHNSYITYMGLSVNGVLQGFQDLQIPPGQTEDESISLKDVILSSAKTYHIEITFTFKDGSTQNYSGDYTTPQFKGQAQILSSSLQRSEFNNTEYYFGIELQNTGNLPMVSANCSIEGCPWSTGLYVMYLKTDMSMKGGGLLLDYGWEDGKAYSVTVQVTYFDGSNSTLRTSVVAQS